MPKKSEFCVFSCPRNADVYTFRCSHSHKCVYVDDFMQKKCINSAFVWNCVRCAVLCCAYTRFFLYSLHRMHKICFYLFLALQNDLISFCSSLVIAIKLKYAFMQCRSNIARALKYAERIVTRVFRALLLLPYLKCIELRTEALMVHLNGACGICTRIYNNWHSCSECFRRLCRIHTHKFKFRFSLGFAHSLVLLH